MSRNPSGRSWYRLSSIVRPTPHSTRDPSPPRRAIESPPSPPSPPSPKEVKEAKRSPVPSPWSREKHEPTPKPRHHENETKQGPSDKTNLVHGPNKEHQQEESLLPRIGSEGRHDKTNLVHGPNKTQQQQSPPSPPKEVKEVKPSPVPSPRFVKHDPKSIHEPPKPRHEHETTDHTKILTSSEKTTFVLNRPNNEQQQDSNISSSDADDFVIGTQGVITISAENKGAVMDIVRKTRGGAGKGEEGTSKTKKHSNNGEHLPMDSFVNSNVQMINGSVVYNTKEKHHDPGVHLSLYRKPLGFIIKDPENGYTSSIN